MLLNAPSTKTLNDHEESAQSEDFDLSENHMQEANRLDRRVDSRVRNIFKLAFATLLKNDEKITPVSEEFEEPKPRRDPETLKSNFYELFKNSSIDILSNRKIEEFENIMQDKPTFESARRENAKWKQLIEDLTWFVIYNEKLQTDLPYHYMSHKQRNRVIEANGTYYRNAIAKKIITLKLVRWFKKRLGIRIKKSTKKIRRKARNAKYEMMKNLIVKRLLKDVVACGVYSGLREKLIDILNDKKRNRASKTQMAENRYRAFLQHQLQLLLAKLAKASKFSVKRRNLRTRYINRRLNRIKKALKRRVVKTVKVKKPAEDKEKYTYKYWIRDLQQKLEGAKQHNKNLTAVNTKSVESKSILLSLVKDVIKKEESPDVYTNVLDNVFHRSSKFAKKKTPRHRNFSPSPDRSLLGVTFFNPKAAKRKAKKSYAARLAEDVPPISAAGRIIGFNVLSLLKSPASIGKSLKSRSVIRRSYSHLNISKIPSRIPPLKKSQLRRDKTYFPMSQLRWNVSTPIDSRPPKNQKEKLGSENTRKKSLAYKFSETKIRKYPFSRHYPDKTGQKTILRASRALFPVTRKIPSKTHLEPSVFRSLLSKKSISGKPNIGKHAPKKLPPLDPRHFARRTIPSVFLKHHVKHGQKRGPLINTSTQGNKFKTHTLKLRKKSHIVYSDKNFGERRVAALHCPFGYTESEERKTKSSNAMVFSGGVKAGYENLLNNLNSRLSYNPSFTSDNYSSLHNPSTSHLNTDPAGSSSKLRQSLATFASRASHSGQLGSFPSRVSTKTVAPTKKIASPKSKEKSLKERKRLERVVLRSVETRIKEIKIVPPKDKDLRTTNILGGCLARHAWKKFYMGKGKARMGVRVKFMPNSKNKKPPWGTCRLYKPLSYNKRIKYFLIVNGFDLTPRKFKSKLYPYSPVSFDAVAFCSEILKDSQKLRCPPEIKRLSKDSLRSVTTRDSNATLDQRHGPAYIKFPHLREEIISFWTEVNDDDVPPMFTLRRELSQVRGDNALYKIPLHETETINLFYLESIYPTLELTDYQDIDDFDIDTKIDRELLHEPRVAKSVLKRDSVQKRKKRKMQPNVFFPKPKSKRKLVVKDHSPVRRYASDGSGGSTLSSKPHKTRRYVKKVMKRSRSMSRHRSIIEPEKSDHRYFSEVGIQVVGRTYFSTKVQVDPPRRKNTGTNVSPSDIYYAIMDEKADSKPFKPAMTHNMNKSDSSSDESGIDAEEPLFVVKSQEFKDCLREIGRVLTSNSYSKEQVFYAGYHVNPLANKLSISYHCVTLWTFHDYRIQLSQLVVSSISIHPFDSNIIAVGYARNDLACKDFGIVCIWNVKTIFAPEKVVKFNSSVTYIEFSHPTTVSVATMGGYVAVINICRNKNSITMTTERTTTASFLPIWQFTWFIGDDEKKFPLSCGADGRIYRYRVDETFAPTLLLEATHMEGKLRGIDQRRAIFRTSILKERPEVTACAQHPKDHQYYFIGTSDGCIHICSLNLKTHIDLFVAQYGRINAIKFHPHCEHIFLTVGGDFTFRIWAIGIFTPLFSLTARNMYTEDACFNIVWPELIISISGEFVDIWNLRRKLDVPIQSWTNPKQLNNTTVTCSTDGYSIIVGDVGGYVHAFRLAEMPCESKLKGEVLSDAIKKALSGRKDLIAALTRLGYPFSAESLPTGGEKDRPVVFLKKTSQ